ncbi:GNAT family N-acetyltransferase [Leptobacterium flavescens]|uniref:GNAT family N-acetyltransferase n=1 Tax=Leptobacterium flavescens TaxID=472055 RepID=A0A6P0UIT5_9FLAO|nr:GNAT family N-acetyltransferase [Leptobacterium flavescens]NER13281.1 GNAT family N-acetyltransferase [Leptobacterium flavescens]
MKIIRASIDHLDIVSDLFNGYRIFYEQESDTEAARSFLIDRMEKGESVIFLALNEDNKGMGFTQLYPVFSSVSMQGFYILNDLYVDKKYRQQGIGEALLEAAKGLCKAEGKKGLALETAKDNPAQKLYERLDWKKDDEFLHYFWKNQ